MRRGWGLREAHQSPRFKNDWMYKVMTSSVEVSWKSCKCLVECIYGGGVLEGGREVEVVNRKGKRIH